MAYVQKENSGSLFFNDRKQNDNHPDRTGKALIGGVWYWVSAWEKNGGKADFLSLAFKEMTPEQADNENAKASGGQSQQRQQPARQQQRPAPPRQQSRPMQNNMATSRPAQRPPAQQPYQDDDQQFKEDDQQF